jgi:hypothetical protein
MSSSIQFAQIHPWGDFVGEQILAADAVEMHVTGIPSGYKWLIVLICARLEAGKPDTTLLIRFNNDAGLNHYSFLKSYAVPGSVFTTASVTGGDIYGQNLQSLRWSTSQLTLSNLPVGGDKSYVMTGGNEAQNFTTTGAWFNAAEISQVDLYTASIDKIKAGSQIMIYGVR